MINVANTVIEKDGQYLLIKRAASSRFFPGQWDFPGGKLKIDEKPEDCAVRETKEETSLRVTTAGLVLEGDHTENGEQIHYRIYSTSDHEGRIRLGEDHSESTWVTKNQINGYVSTPFVRAYFARS